MLSGMDRTEEFKRAIKHVIKTNKLISNFSSESTKARNPLQKRQETEFKKKAKEILKSITKLKDFLLLHRNAYINARLNISGAERSMSDLERDKIDEDAQNVIKTCKETIQSLQQNFEKKGKFPQENDHRHLVIASIYDYLESVCKVYSEQRAIRVKLVVEKKRISRLHNPESLKKALLSKPSEVMEKDESNIPKLYSNGFIDDDSDDEITEEDASVLEQENTLLFNDMNSMVDEVRSIEGKVVEIARLQKIFSEQVLKQEDDIEIISDKVMESTENVRDGNEEIREAIKKNAGFRVWILFFLVMCSFSLLFLEWYS